MNDEPEKAVVLVIVGLVVTGSLVWVAFTALQILIAILVAVAALGAIISAIASM
ncbi:MAG TPA: hypothetical protein VFO16_04775 [Pseudonocardiaceae bacterium]|nr:hypothetical protein [Pseudonocardiaceae bacterium]